MIWLVQVRECDYDEYDAVVVRADSEADALALAKGKFTDSQWKGHSIERVDTSDGQGVILASFNAG